MAPVVQLPAALRLAPLQTVTWGHPVTTGLPTMDRFLTSASMESNDGDAHYSERLYRLANLGICYALPDEALRDDGGESAEGPQYVCTQSLFKLLPAFDAMIAAIAREAGRCRFDFIAHDSPDVTAAFQRRLGKAFTAVGLNAADFCRFHPFMSRAAYFAFNRRADVILDSVPWSGGKTTLDAVACGKVVVTLPGLSMRSRHSAGILGRAGVLETIAADPDDYVAIAVRLGRDRAWRREIETKVRAGHGRVFNDRAPIEDLQAFLLTESGK